MAVVGLGLGLGSGVGVGVGVDVGPINAAAEMVGQ